MNQTAPKPPTFLREIAPWVRGKNIAVYLHNRPKPLTGLIVKHIGTDTLVARWNSSTHLIPLAAIAFIRFAPDCDPCRDSEHPLHPCMNNRKPQPYRRRPDPDTSRIPAGDVAALSAAIAPTFSTED